MLRSDGQWYRDQGIATYNPTTYEIQRIAVLNSYGLGSVVLSMQDYLTPNTLNTTMLYASSFTMESTAVQVHKQQQQQQQHSYTFVPS